MKAQRAKGQSGKGTKQKRDKDTKEQRDIGIQDKDFSALCLCHFAPLSLNMLVLADNG
jgi:hypothetical protein